MSTLLITDLSHEEIQQAKHVYGVQRTHARIRNINWNFTFESWMQFWLDSGHWEERGRKKHQHVMARNGDTGPYSEDNVRIVTASQNAKELVYTDEMRKKISIKNKGSKRTDEVKKKLSDIQKGMARKGGNNPSAKKCIVNGVHYDCIKHAAEANNMRADTLNYRIRSKNFPEYNW